MTENSFLAPFCSLEDAYTSRPLRKLVLRMDPGQVYFLKFVLEGYDNLFMLSTLDKEQGVMILQSADGTQDELARILISLKDRIGLKCAEVLQGFQYP